LFKDAMLRRILRFLIRWLFRILTRFEVQGQGHIPAEGGLLIAVNHLSRFDPLAVFCLIDRQRLTGLVADKYQHHPIIAPVVRFVDGIWINREEADFHALRKATEYLQSGGILGIAPEGTRSSERGLIAPKTGVAYLADKGGVPVLPVAIIGTDMILESWRRLRRPRVQVRIGEPFRLPPLERKTRAVQLQENTDAIMLCIAAMLPPEYRGVYAEDPRLKALLVSP
jgi:1-acyl-sn-glycerol-3-phosphate acyltransferase